jgi:hypothetical protein
VKSVYIPQGIIYIPLDLIPLHIFGKSKYFSSSLCKSISSTIMAPSRVATPPPVGINVKSAPETAPTTAFGDFRDDFYRDGFVIIKGAVAKEKAARYQSEAFTWLEGFGLGFDRNDKSTWKKDKVPQSWKGGMYLHFAAAHEKYVWEARW